MKKPQRYYAIAMKEYVVVISLRILHHGKYYKLAIIGRLYLRIVPSIAELVKVAKRMVNVQPLILR